MSYSWTEEREGQNAKAVNDFCVQLTTGGIEVIRDFLLRAAPTLIQQKSGSSNLTDAATAGEIDLVTVFKGISERLSAFSGSSTNYVRE